jgi:NAD(P)-dependent dehydrogenase (short-subunit alcohol dehydrogenase family)
MNREISKSKSASSESKPEVVVITGTSGGVGRATTQAFARLGAHIGLLARGHEGLENTRKEVEFLGGRAIVIPTDVAYPDQVEAAAERVENEFGPIDIWVNNAMTKVFSPFKDVTPEEFKRATEVTYLGAAYGTMAAISRTRLPRHPQPVPPIFQPEVACGLHTTSDARYMWVNPLL